MVGHYMDIEHIVAWAEARRSGLSCDRPSEFMNDPLNITVAYPRVNRHQKATSTLPGGCPSGINAGSPPV